MSKKQLGIWSFFIGGILALVAFLFGPYNLNEWLIQGLQGDQASQEFVQEADLFIVLGSGLRTNGALTNTAQERVNYAMELYAQTQTDIMFSGGETPYGIEAVEMNEEAKRQGYNGLDHIEASSHSTYENAFYSDQLLDQGEIEDARILVVTSPYHSRRALQTFMTLMPEREVALAYPQETVMLEDSPRGRLKGAYNLVREYAAIAWYRLRFQVPLQPTGDSVIQLGDERRFSFVAQDGEELYGRILRAEEPSPASVMLFVPGATSTIRAFDDYNSLPVFAQSPLVLFDHRGQGVNSHTERIDADTYVTDIMQLVLWASQQYPESQVVLIGEGLGANSVLLTAEQLPQDVDMVLALSPSRDYSGVTLSEQRSFVGTPILIATSADDGASFASLSTLRTRYPQAYEQLFEDAGHGVTLLEQDALIVEFTSLLQR